MNVYEQILAGLKTKFKGVEDATLQRIASKKSDGVTDEGKVNSIVEEISFQDVLNSYGDYRANGASETSRRNAIADYEKQHHLKDGKPVEGNQQQTQQQQNEPTLAEQIAAALGAALKPLNDRLDAMDEKTKADVRNKQIEEVAKSFGIPEFAYKGKQIAEEADLNKYFTDLKQEMQNSGYSVVKAPEEGDHEHQSEISSIAEQINKGTQEIVKQDNK